MMMQLLVQPLIHPRNEQARDSVARNCEGFSSFAPQSPWDQTNRGLEVGICVCLTPFKVSSVATVTFLFYFMLSSNHSHLA